MSIEKNLERIADALEKIAGSTAIASAIAALSINVTVPSGEPSKPASTGSRRQAKNVEREDRPEPVDETPPAEEPPVDDMGLDDPVEEPAAEEPKYTEDDVRKALKNYRDINGGDATMKVLKDQGGGATGMGSLKPEFYAAVMKVVR